VQIRGPAEADANELPAATGIDRGQLDLAAHRRFLMSEKLEGDTRHAGIAITATTGGCDAPPLSAKPAPFRMNTMTLAARFCANRDRTDATTAATPLPRLLHQL
jgi:hypothetical protein